MGDVLVVTWQGGGAALGALGLAEELVARGHQVRVAAPPSLAAGVAAAGAEHVAHPHSVVFDVAAGRAMEDQATHFGVVFHGPGLPRLVVDEIHRRRPDVVVVDALLRSSVDAVADLGLPLVVLVHMARAFRSWDAVIARAELALVTLPAALDPWDAPCNVVHVGPLESRRSSSAWRSPWAADDPRPLVVVTLGTTYMHQEGALGRAAVAARSLGARVLVLTGDELAPDELELNADDGTIRAERYVPHDAVLPGAAAVVHHAGIGTTLAALRAGIPAVCLPLGRDQHINAAHVAALGAAITVHPSAPTDTVRCAIRRALVDRSLRTAATGLSEVVARCGGAPQAAGLVEALILGFPRPPGTVPATLGEGLFALRWV